MINNIKKVTIIGSGTMGQGIAAHLSNAGIKSYLLDIVPKNLTSKEEMKGLTLNNSAVRNRIVKSNKKKSLKVNPSLYMDKKDSKLVITGNIEDNLDWLSDSDWIIECVSENLEIKESVLSMISKSAKPGTIVSTNTSGMSINELSNSVSNNCKKYLLGIHFFNPVRYMPLVELIPSKETDTLVIEYMNNFLQKKLGKQVVIAKDSPNFIANRIGVYRTMLATRLMKKYNLSINEVDELRGQVVGGTNNAMFKTLDIIGLDVFLNTVSNSIKLDDELVDELFYEMKKRKYLGRKTEQGFYKKNGANMMVIDTETFEYKPIKSVNIDSINKAKSLGNQREKILELYFNSNDKAGKYMWQLLKNTFLFAASRIPEISDSILDIDKAMRYGFNFSFGPFEMWQGLDLPKYIQRMKDEGDVIPEWVVEMISSDNTSFYKNIDGLKHYYCINKKKYIPVQTISKVITIEEAKSKNKVLLDESEGILFDIGDNVLCLSLKKNKISSGTIKLLNKARLETNKKWSGMIVTTLLDDFSLGLDYKELAPFIMESNIGGLDNYIKSIQDTFISIKYSDKPIVFAPKGKVLGAGCEMIMQGAAVQASSESYLGMFDIGLGLIPTFGGTKEMIIRGLDNKVSIRGTYTDQDFLAPGFEAIATAKITSSAKQAYKYRILKPEDEITMNKALLLEDSKRKVLELIDRGYTAPYKKDYIAPGKNGVAFLKSMGRIMQWTKQISDYDYLLLTKLVGLFAGKGVSDGEIVNEQYILDSERETFLELINEKKTLERIMSLRKTGKPIRN